VICYNPEQAERDAALREAMTGKLTTLIAETDRLTVTKRAELRGRIPQRASPAIPLDPHPSRPCPPRRAASMSGSIEARERHRPWRCTQLFWWRVRSPRSTADSW